MRGPRRPSTATNRAWSARRGEMSPRFAPHPALCGCPWLSGYVPSSSPARRARALAPVPRPASARPFTAPTAPAPGRRETHMDRPFPGVVRALPASRAAPPSLTLVAATGHSAPPLPATHCRRAPHRAAVAPAARCGGGSGPRQILAHTARLPHPGRPRAASAVRLTARCCACTEGAGVDPCCPAAPSAVASAPSHAAATRLFARRVLSLGACSSPCRPARRHARGRGVPRAGGRTPQPRRHRLGRGGRARSLRSQASLRCRTRRMTRGTGTRGGRGAPLCAVRAG